MTVALHTRQFRIRLCHIQKFAQSGKLLDVGMGNGLFLKLAKQAGFEIQETKLSEPGKDSADKYGFPVRQGQLTDIDFGNKQFDIISMWHVLEDVPNPGEVLTKTPSRRHFCRGGSQ